MVMADRIEPRTLFSPDDVANYIGAGYFIWETADANANLLELIFPEGGAIDVPAFVIADVSIAGIDLGASGIDLSGLTEPSLVIVNDAKDAYVRLDAGDDSIAGSKGLYFHPTADENVEIINVSVTGTPRIYWDEGNNRFAVSPGILIEVGGLTLRDDIPMYLGNSADAVMIYETADANAELIMVALPHVDEDANNVAVLALVDRDAYGTDLGAGGIDLNGITQPTLAVCDEDSDSAILLTFGADDTPEIKLIGNADFGNSTKDPRAVLPDDWARFNIGGVAYYSPLYLVS